MGKMQHCFGHYTATLLPTGKEVYKNDGTGKNTTKFKIRDFQ